MLNCVISGASGALTYISLDGNMITSQKITITTTLTQDMAYKLDIAWRKTGVKKNAIIEAALREYLADAKNAT